MTKSTYSTTEFIFNYFNNMILKPSHTPHLAMLLLGYAKKAVHSEAPSNYGAHCDRFK